MTRIYEVLNYPVLPPTPYDVKELISFSTENTINPREIFIYLVMVMRSFAVLTICLVRGGQPRTVSLNESEEPATDLSQNFGFI